MVTLAPKLTARFPPLLFPAHCSKKKKKNDAFLLQIEKKVSTSNRVEGREKFRPPPRSRQVS